MRPELHEILLEIKIIKAYSDFKIQFQFKKKTSIVYIEVFSTLF